LFEIPSEREGERQRKKRGIQSPWVGSIYVMIESEKVARIYSTEELGKFPKRVMVVDEWNRKIYTRHTK
jgi:hypothetical protein